MLHAPDRGHRHTCDALNSGQDTDKLCCGGCAQPGVTTDDIDKAVHKMIIDNGAYPSPLTYGKLLLIALVAWTAPLFCWIVVRCPAYLRPRDSLLQ